MSEKGRGVSILVLRTSYLACRTSYVNTRHLSELLLQGGGHLFAGRARKVRTEVFIETTFAVYTVECTHFAIGGHQVDAQ